MPSSTMLREKAAWIRTKASMAASEAVRLTLDSIAAQFERLADGVDRAGRPGGRPRHGSADHFEMVVNGDIHGRNVMERGGD